MQEFLNRISAFSPKRLALLAYELQTRIDELESSGTEPIAIVGVGCRLPGGVNDSDSYWTLLRDGVDGVCEVPKDRWNIDDYFDANPDAPGKMSTRWGGFLGNIDNFDPQFFGISPREAESMDPQQRLLLEVAWEALEHAAIAPADVFGTKTGIFIGMSASDYYHVIRANGIGAFNAYTASGTAHSIASGRLSYVLGAQGPCVAIDTSCSSSLVAIHQAVQSLRAKECNLALAGGVNLILNPDVTIALSKAHMMAPDGRCKAFDARADGFVRSEGCGILVLKRLREARKAGDRIVAVIRGSAVNQDGRSNGLTAPNGASQETVIRDALINAHAEPAQVGYVEAHGTGTSLGDPIEVQALGAVFGIKRDAANPLLVGSVKTNLGHLEAAAGVAAVIKVALALQHAEIPPQLHLEQPNPFIPWGELPVRVTTSLTKWEKRDGQSRLAGVSSFGFSGTNAHLILEEAPPIEDSRDFVKRPPSVLAISARTSEVLEAMMNAYSIRLDSGTDQLADVAYTADTGREHFAHRIAVVASSREQALSRITEYRMSGYAAGVASGVMTTARPPKIAFLFTGKGSQYARMGSTLYDTYPVFRTALDRVAEILRPTLPRSLTSVIFDREAASLIEGDQYAQAATFAIEYALAALWASWGVRPSAVLGHDIGEYVAACVAGVLSLEDAIQLLVARGAARTITYGQAELDLISSVTGEIVNVDTINASYWRTQATSPARFTDGIAMLAQRNFDVFIEIGPHPVLIEIVKKTFPESDATWLPSLVSERDGGDQMVESLATLYARGGEIDWKGVHSEQDCRKVTLPTYQFQRARYWIPEHGTGEDVPPRILNLFHDVKWRDVGSVALNPVRKADASGTWIIVGGEGVIADTLTLELRKCGANPVTVQSDDTIRLHELLRAQVDTVISGMPALAGILYVSALDNRLDESTSTEQLESAQRRQLGGMLDIVHSTADVAGARQIAIWIVTRGAQSVTWNESANPAQATLWGMSHVVAIEHPELGCVRIDLDPNGEVADDARAIVGLMREGVTESQIALRGSRRLARRLTRIKDSSSTSLPTRLLPDATYLVTGGLRGLGLRVAERLVERGARYLVLMGRSGANDKATAVIRRLEARGVRVHVATGDVGDADDVRDMLAHIRGYMPRLSGVVHAAGVLDDGILAQLTWERFERVLRPKVLGAWNLHTLTSDLDFLVLFSSGASLAGSAGQANYTAANAFEDALAYRRQAAGLPTVSINWGPWAQIGAAADRHVRALQFMDAITPEDGLAALDWAMRRDPATNLFVHSQVGVLKADWDIYTRQYPRGEVPLLFSELVTDDRPRSTEGVTGPDVSATSADTLRSRIAASVPNRRRAVLRDFVRSQAITVLGGERQGRIDDTQPLHDVGLDSLMAVELRNILGRAGDRTLPATLTFDHPTIDALVDYLSVEIFAEEMTTAAARDVSAATRQRATERAPDRAITDSETLDNLSDDALASLLAEQLEALDTTDIP